MVALLGQNDELLRVVEAEFDADILVRGNEITVTAEAAEAEAVLTLYEDLIRLVEQGHTIDREALQRTVRIVRSGAVPSDVLSHSIISTPARIVRPKSVGQKRYAEAIEQNTVTFAIGPAGTGKTYLAMAAAVRALQERVVQRIILTRPAVEAGEKLGFLPGDLLAKVDPYLRPLYDSLYDILGPEATARLMERGSVEVAPLAYMRGRTLNDSFVVLDEAQNTSPEQMKMFLTRIGFGAKTVVTGDVTQIDLPGSDRSGLMSVPPAVFEVEGVARVELGSEDVVRHPIVAKIVDAYEAADRAAEQRGPRPRPQHGGDRGTPTKHGKRVPRRGAR
ncbi:MAG: PhoH family protein [Acidimicrobiia bacterium]|nr:PhoH family protein [Acidimicrobiia bacterium]